MHEPALAEAVLKEGRAGRRDTGHRWIHEQILGVNCASLVQVAHRERAISEFVEMPRDLTQTVQKQDDTSILSHAPALTETSSEVQFSYVMNCAVCAKPPEAKVPQAGRTFTFKPPSRMIFAPL